MLSLRCLLKSVVNRIAIKSFDYGNQFIAITSETYEDVRLVGTPPEAVGKFGGETDNWVWPRHNADFSIFRIYANKNNEPALYSEHNQPFKARRSLKISTKGVKEGDFTMIYGFPGRTERYLPKSAIDFKLASGNASHVDMRDEVMKIYEREIKASDDFKLLYATKYARVANYYKKLKGETRGLKRLSASETKKEFQANFKRKAREQGKEKYIDALTKASAIYSENQDLFEAANLLVEFAYYGNQRFKLMRDLEAIVKNKVTHSDSITPLALKVKKTIRNYYAHNWVEIDKEVFKTTLTVLVNHAKPTLLPHGLRINKESNSEKIDEWVDTYFSSSIFADTIQLFKVLDKSKVKKWNKLSDDPAIRLTTDFNKHLKDNIWKKRKEVKDPLNNYMSIYVKGIKELMPEIKQWPNANSTLRITYGQVQGSQPKDGILYNSFTTADGILEKYIPNDMEFHLPSDFVALLKSKKYGRYANEEGKLPVAFIATNHTTGGNSGSPVLNADGDLVGLNFDRSWESTMSDVMFDPKQCRNIMVDIRYILFIIDKYGKADYLINEMIFD